jgi:pimeloyl-ACP methyl ester carboxylesterase
MSPISLLITLGITLGTPESRDSQRVRIPITAAREIDLSAVVRGLAAATGQAVAVPAGPVVLPISGPGGVLTRRLLTESLGPAATLLLQGEELVISLDRELLVPERLPEWRRRLDDLAGRAEREARRRMSYGMFARSSYQPNDTGRPTVCLVHGLNSSSRGFVHMVGPLEKAGYGVVVFDYAFNRPVEESCARFRRDWQEFRRARGETRPWAIVAHSMGALVARGLVEDPTVPASEISTLILIAPVNQGSSLARAQALRQWLEGFQAVHGKAAADPLAYLGDGLGEAAADLLPGSTFLTALNARPRRAGVPYHILAGNAGFLPLEARRRIEGQLVALRQQGGFLAGLGKLVSRELAAQLDELCDGTGDGAVSVERSRLDGVADHVTIPANHAELIRAPLFFPDPGPVVSMPYILRWLKAAAPAPGPVVDGSR